MSYDTSKLNLVNESPFEGNFNIWAYVTTDSFATVTGSNYISDGVAKGMKKGDIVWMVNQSTPDVQRLIVASLGTAAATLSAETLVGFYGTAPIAQQSGASQAAVTTTASTTSTPYGYATSTQANGVVTLLNEVRTVLVNYGLMAGS